MLTLGKQLRNRNIEIAQATSRLGLAKRMLRLDEHYPRR